VDNTVPESMEEVEKRLEELSEATVKEVMIKEAEENWVDWDSAAEDLRRCCSAENHVTCRPLPSLSGATWPSPLNEMDKPGQQARERLKRGKVLN
jgi:hypothetical protein